MTLPLLSASADQSHAAVQLQRFSVFALSGLEGNGTLLDIIGPEI